MARAVKSVSVVIPTYNEEKNIGKCLSALNGQSLPREEFEVIVVDGGSKDRTVKISKDIGAKVMRQVSRGVGGARNDGVAASKGRLIATTDADCVPCDYWLENIVARFDEDAKIAALTGALKPMIDDMGVMEGYKYRALFGLCNMGFYPAASLIANHVGVGYTHLCGANSAFRRDAFEEVGGYSDLSNADDLEISKRLKPLGKIVFDKKIPVDYSVRRIRKMGLPNYVMSCLETEFDVMVRNRKDIPGNYAKQDYG